MRFRADISTGLPRRCGSRTDDGWVLLRIMTAVQTAKTPRVRLFAMMLLQFFIWGAWLPLIFSYLPSLDFSPAEQAWILNAFPAAAVIGLFFSNQLADRRFAAERFLAFSHLISGMSIFGLSMVSGFWSFLLLMWIHCLFYVPTISITNSIAFAHMNDPKTEFGPIRMGGTIGWILAAWPFTFIFVDWAAVEASDPQGLIDWLGTALASGLTGEALQAATPWTYRVAGIAGLVLAAFSIFLPHTPPESAQVGRVEKLAWLEAVRWLRHPFILVLWLVALADSIVHNAYFNWAAVFFGSDQVGINGNWIMPVMSIGQVAEILTMMVLGAALKAMGWKITLIVGVLGYAVRFWVFAIFPDATTLIVLVNVLHGICYAFFFASLYIFVDACFPQHARSSAQGLFNVMILGLGALIANSICPWLLQEVYTVDGVTDFRSLFLLPAAISLGAALVLAMGFKPPASIRLVKDSR